MTHSALHIQAEDGKSECRGKPTRVYASQIAMARFYQNPLGTMSRTMVNETKITTTPPDLVIR